VSTFLLFAQATTTPPESTTSMLLQGAVTILFVVLSVLGGLASKAVSAYAATSKYGNLINQLWLLVQTTVSHAEAEVKPGLLQAAANSKLTPEDGQKLKSLVMASLKKDGMSQLTTLAKSYGLSEEAASTMLSGLIERAVTMITPAEPAVEAFRASLRTPVPSSSPSGTLLTPPGAP
jgi:hypothetical protein